MIEIRQLFEKSQENISTHQKLITTLRGIYKKEAYEDVKKSILKQLDLVFCENYKINKVGVIRSISFVAQFLVDLLTEHNDDETEEPLVRAVINRTLQHVDFVNPNHRYHSTKLLEMFFNKAPPDLGISSELCDDIQEHLIKRFINDPVLSIRLLCASPLSKLQDIENIRCPVISTYTRMCNDPSPLIRKAAIANLALTHLSHEIPIRLMRDTDANVRLQAYKRVSCINPRLLKIVMRQQVIINGVDESQLSVRKVFETKLLPKWIQVYEHNLLMFFNSFWLDAEEKDIQETRIIYEELMKIFFKYFSQNEILKYLPIGNDGIVPIDQLTAEVSAYWYNFVVNLQKDENSKVEVEVVLPQLTPFCSYIQSVIKSKDILHLEVWENHQFQEVLYNLLQMVSISDLADEVGRQHLKTLLRETLLCPRLSKNVVEKIIELYKIFINGIDQQCEEICALLSDIREVACTIEEVPMEISETQKMKIQFLKAKLFVLEASIEKAIEDQKFTEADKINIEIKQIKKEIDALNAPQPQPPTIRERDVKLDSATMCHCLDILTAFLRTTRFRTLPSSLRICLNEFVKPAMETEDVNVHAKIFMVLGQFCIIDKDLALNHMQYVCSPLLAHKYGRCDKASIIGSVQAISDLVRIHGPDILGDDDDDMLSISSTGSKNGKRRLYQETSPEDIVAQCTNISRGLIMDIILDLIDEEDEDIRHTTAMSLMRLVINGLLVNSSLLTRLFLKWLNPNTEKHDPMLQQIIGSGLVKYAMHIKNSILVIQRTIIPTLNFIGNAPDNSPFQDVELDHVLHSLCNILIVQRTDVTNVHKNLILEIIRTIKNRPNAKSVYILTKMLFVLEQPKHQDENFVSECLDDLEVATQYVGNVKVLKLLMKFKDVLRNEKTNSTTREQTNQTMTTNSINTTNTINETVLTNEVNESIQTNERGNKENENLSMVNGSLNGVLDESMNTSRKKRPRKTKNCYSKLAVIVERSSDVEKIVQQQMNLSSSSESLDSGKRKRPRSKRTSQNDRSNGQLEKVISRSNSVSSCQSSPSVTTRSRSQKHRLHSSTSSDEGRILRRNSKKKKI